MSCRYLTPNPEPNLPSITPNSMNAITIYPDVQVKCQQVILTPSFISHVQSMSMSCELLVPALPWTHPPLPISPATPSLGCLVLLYTNLLLGIYVSFPFPPPISFLPIVNQGDLQKHTTEQIRPCYSCLISSDRSYFELNTNFLPCL